MHRPLESNGFAGGRHDRCNNMLNQDLRKGLFSVTTLVGLVAAFGGVAIVMGAYVEGPIAQIIDRGTENIEDRSDYTIDIENEQDISDLSMLVYHRASNVGCKFESREPMKCPSGDKHPYVCVQNTLTPEKYAEEKENLQDLGVDVDGGVYEAQSGYPALEDTYLGRYPTCAGARSTTIRGPVDTGFDSGNDMEGIFSRERFVVKEPVVLYTRDASDTLNPGEPTYLERRLAGFSKKSFDYWASKCGRGLGGDIDVKGGRDYLLYFDTGKDVSSRMLSQDPWITDLNRLNEDKGPYCGNKGPEKIGYPSAVALCPGDKGYIQMNKGEYPDDETEASVGLGSNAANYPFIQITRVNGTGEDACDAAKRIGDGLVQPRGTTSSEAMVYRANYQNFPEAQKVQLGGAREDVNYDFIDSSNCALSMADLDSGSTDLGESGIVYFRNGTEIGQKGRFPPLGDQGNYPLYNFEEGNLGEKSAKDIYQDYLFDEGFSNRKISNNEFDFLRGIASEGNQIFAPYGNLMCGDLQDDGKQRAVWAVCQQNLDSDEIVVGENSQKTYYCDTDTGDWISEAGRQNYAENPEENFREFRREERE